MKKEELVNQCTFLIEQIGSIIYKFFYWCVDVLIWIGDITGMGYMLANIVIFVILQPALILLFMFLWLKERRKK
jgi:uncharacterized membrane protein